MAQDEATVEIREGMEVVTEDGKTVGHVTSMLVDEEAEAVAFLLVRAAEDETPRIVPSDAITDASEDLLVVEVSPDELGSFPELPGDQDPTEDDLRKAYEALGIDVDAG